MPLFNLVKPIVSQFDETKPNLEPSKFEWTSPESECSVKCGPGIKTVTTVTCVKENENTDTKCETRIEKKECTDQPECPVEMSLWSEWSECSLKCVSDITQQSVKTRSRTCIPSPCKDCGHR